MKLIIQIPCYNEERTLPLLFERMPRELPGIDQIEFLVIDDGCTDATAEVARSLGVHHVVKIPGRNRRWLGRAFKLGTMRALELGADIVVNTDGDNQYPSDQIGALVRPIVEGRAQVVIGDRNPGRIVESSLAKRALQSIGNRVLSLLTGEPPRDGVSGFRAYSREALLRIHIITKFSYTLDTLIQCEKKGLAIEWIPITPNAATRESRLFDSIWTMAGRSALSLLRLITVYEPFRAFLAAALVAFLPAVTLLGRFAYFFFFVHEEAAGHVQSVIVGGALLVIAVLLAVFGVIGGLLAVNRALIEELLTRVRKLELDQGERKG